MSDYTPIACALHDRLESLATLRPVVRIEYVDDNGDVRAAEDRIIDVFARAGAEYLRTTLLRPVFPDLWAIRTEF